MYDTIMVPLDGSAAGEQALPLALAVAGRAGARIEIVIVRQDGAPPFILPPTPPPDSEADREPRVGLGEYVEAVAQRIRGRVRECRSVVLEGVPAAELISYARETGTDLIAMTTHGRGGLSRAWLGSVAEQVVREVHVPVLLRRPEDDGSEPDAPAFRRILVPLDESAVSESILNRASVLAELFGSTMTLLHVVEPIIVRARMVTSPAIEIDEADLARQARRAERYLEETAGRLRQAGIAVESMVVGHDQPARAVLEAARDSDVDLIAMATRGHGGLRRLMIGSVADKVLRGADCPLLLYRPPRA